MKIVIKTQGTLAIYEQIASQMKHEIVSGKLKAGEALPSIRSLASELQVSVITTKRAYEELEKENLVRPVPGKGFYVCECSREYLQEKTLVSLERHLTEVMNECISAGLSNDEILDMVNALLETRSE